MNNNNQAQPSNDNNQQQSADIRSLKTSMTLDFASNGESRKRTRVSVGYPEQATPNWQRNQLNPVQLDSSDEKMLKFNTPEIEKFLINSSSGFTPTLPAFLRQISEQSHGPSALSLTGLTPSINSYNQQTTNVEHGTSEQQEFVLPFEMELQKLRSQESGQNFEVPTSEAHHHNQLNREENNNNVHEGDHYQLTQLKDVQQQRHEMYQPASEQFESHFENQNGSQYSHGKSMHNNQPMATHNLPQYSMVEHVQIKQELDNGDDDSEQDSVLNHQTHLSLGSYSPIDMADQERIKLERKRLRNRIAASKCRRRKLDKIARLEEKVKNLKGENGELSMAVTRSRDAVMRLKQELIEHVKSGCQVSGGAI